MQTLQPNPYSGTRMNIVIGIDVGTTFSGVSYAILRPGEIPQVRPVARFSDQPMGDNKIPSIIYYDRNGVPKAIGAATALALVQQNAAQEGWFRTEHFKMYFHPHRQSLETFGLKLGELPPNKTREDVMGDFLRYLYEETAKYVSDAHTAETWVKVKENAIFVISHPNGWPGQSQSRYRVSAVKAGLIPDTNEGHKRIKFITEGEASGLASLASGVVAAESIKRGFRFMVVDAGGGTVDISSFEVTETSPLKIRERSIPDSRFAGSVFVNIYGKKLLQKTLSNSRFGDEETIDGLINDAFETSTKRVFTGEMDGLVQVGSRRENDNELNISAGFLHLDRESLAHCFKHSVSQTVDSIWKQLSNNGRNDGIIMDKHVWLVGGFGNSPYLLNEIRRAFCDSGFDVQTPNMNLSKTVASGAIMHFLNWAVVTRICPTTYGTTFSPRYDPSRPDHRKRQQFAKKEKDGLVIGPVFDPIVEKGTPVEVGKTFTSTYSNRSFTRKDAACCSAEILSYDGDLPAPYWYDENKVKFKTVCRVEADLSTLWKAEFRAPPLLKRWFGVGDGQWNLPNYDIDLEFGNTELEAKIRWEEKGIVKYGPAKIIWPE